MSVFFKDWIISLTGAAILTGAALSLTPKGRVRGVLQLLCGVVMALSLIRPVLDADLSVLLDSLPGGAYDTSEIEQSVSDTNLQLTGRIIEEETAAYILDKAQVLGNSALTVTVTAKCGDDGCYYPYEVDIRGPEYAREALTAIIESELGIPWQRQYWSGKNEED